MSERQEGWYHVKRNGAWECHQYRRGQFYCDNIDEIGSRIPAPDEPWVTVPVEATVEMQNAGSVARYYDRKDCKGLYKSMLAAAPKP